jgi:ubiquinone/menaquinone biosynthesis C-methylase UbiE
MFDCTTERYDEIYAPWLANPGELLDLGNYIPGRDHLLDLCGGSGIVALEALRRSSEKSRKSSIAVLDLNPRGGFNPDDISETHGQAQHASLIYKPGTFNLVICRQALGYLDLVPVFRAVGHVLARGGRFVFNSFLQPRRYATKHYTYRDQTYAEAHLYLMGRVFHVQCKLTGVPGADVSVFRYHSPETIRKALWDSGHKWLIREDCRDRSVHWLCVKR